MDYMGVNLVAVFVSAVANMAIGFLWYSPLMFAKPWMKLRGYTEKSMKEAQAKMGPKYGLSFLAAIVTSWALGKVIVMTGAMGSTEGVQLAFLMWLGFTTTVQLTAWIFSDNKKELYFIDTGYQLVFMLVAGAILGMWA